MHAMNQASGTLCLSQERARGATAYRVEASKPAERLAQFDPQAMQIIMVPRVVGG